MGNAANAINNNNYKRVYGGDLNYPVDIGHTERTGHYVQFFINVQEQSKVSFPKGSFNARLGRGSDVSRESSTLSIERAPTKRLAASIQLYMPNQVSVSHSASYSDEEISSIITGTGGAIDKIVGGNFDLGDAGSRALEGAKNMATGAVGKVVTGTKQASNIATGKITNNRQELMFNGIDKRSFSFDFKMVPKSEEESENIKNIVNMFRFHAMPEFYAGSERTLISPSTFDIKYMHKNGEHTFLNRISTCVLESVSVKYGGDRTQFFINTAPASTDITLQFKELEIITKERIRDGY
jgi:hypothetical protein